jgi:asparagine synthase (glutamine-hydrolysing)
MPRVEPHLGTLDVAFEAAIRRCVAGSTKPVVLFSGGVDSGLLAWELRGTPGCSLFTVGRDGSEDLENAEPAAAEVGLPWLGRRLDDDDLRTTVAAVASDLAEVPGPRRGIFVALAAAIAHAPDGRLVCGQGADELFFGYAHYRGLSAAAASARSSTDLATLLEQDWPLTQRVAGRWDRELVAPYLDSDFLTAARGIPPEDRLPGVQTKELFRRWAADRGLPARLAGRPKRALQYGSGVDRWLREHRPREP